MLFLYCESAVINIIANVASLLLTVSGSKDHCLTHGFWQQHGPMDIHTASNVSMVSGSSVNVCGQCYH